MAKQLRAEILCVGTEILLGNITNTNARDLSVYLSELGINVFYQTVVGDNPERLTEAVALAKTRADIIITTGGLGPTCDDLTKQVLAKAFGLEMVFHEEIAEEMKRYFRETLGVTTMTENNFQQAELPAGCTIFHNEWGTAPGCAFEVDGVHVLMLPGPPRECNAMFKACAMPYLRKLSDEIIVSHSLRIVGSGESSVEAKLRDMMNELTNPTLAPYAKEGEVQLRVTAKAKTEAECETMMKPVLDRVCGILGDIVYGMDVESLEEVVFKLLKEKQLTIATAESCTGGLIAKRLTDLRGSSEVFRGGAVTYATDTKTSVLGVPAALIAEHGVISGEVAREMAVHAREVFGADLAVATTGLAGPDGDGKNPVGTLFVALATDKDVYVSHISSGMGRARVRILGSSCALDMTRRYLTGLPVVVDYYKK